VDPANTIWRYHLGPELIESAVREVASSAGHVCELSHRRATHLGFSFCGGCITEGRPVTETIVPMASALGFTLGCAGIHHLRRHAGKITPLLVGLVLMLIDALYTTWIVQDGPPQVDDTVMLDEAGVYDAGMPVPAP
jgi:hypothetical protein